MLNAQFYKAVHSAGRLLEALADGSSSNRECHGIAVPDDLEAAFTGTLDISFRDNVFFHPYLQRFSLKSIAASMMDASVLENWLGRYDIPEHGYGGVRLGIVAAGNIPAVCFHDYLVALACGVRADVKLSSKDRYLPVFLHSVIGHAAADCPCVSERLSRIRFVDRLDDSGYDAVLVTGGDEAVSHYRKLYGNIPVLSRCARFSFSVLYGNEDDSALDALAEDIVLYYGLGCRSVSCVLYPEGYGLDRIADAVSRLRKRMVSSGFDPAEVLMPAYRRQKALLTMKGEPYADLGFMLLCTGDCSVFPPFSCVKGLSYPESEADASVAAFESGNRGRIQKKYVNFGAAQHPAPDDYADGLDTVEFILGIKSTAI